MEKKFDYSKFNECALFLTYDALTYNVWLIRHEYVHGNIEMTEDEFEKRLEQNVKLVYPVYDQIEAKYINNDLSTNKNEKFANWYSIWKKNINRLRENEFKEMTKLYSTYINADCNCSEFEDFCSLNFGESENI